MEFLKEFIKQENITLLKELLKLNNKKCSENEEEYKKELLKRINDNNKFLYVNEKEAAKCL